MEFVTVPSVRIQQQVRLDEPVICDRLSASVVSSKKRELRTIWENKWDRRSAEAIFSFSQEVDSPSPRSFRRTKYNLIHRRSVLDACQGIANTASGFRCSRISARSRSSSDSNCPKIQDGFQRYASARSPNLSNHHISILSDPSSPTSQSHRSHDLDHWSEQRHGL